MTRNGRLTKSKMLILAILCAGADSTTPVLANEVQDLKIFDVALAEGKLDKAAEIYGRLFEARLPKDGKPKPDATLDAFAGRLFFAEGNPIEAIAFLKMDATGDTGDAAARQFALAGAMFVVGEYADAAKRYANLAESLGGDQQTRALIGQAQATIMTDPSAAAPLIAKLASTNPSLVWRISFVEAQQALLRKDYAAAQKAADRAMIAANVAPVRDYAPLQTLQLQAAVAAAQGRREQVAALLGAVPSNSNLSMKTASTIANRLPRCGDAGITEDDYVIIGLFTPQNPSIKLAAPMPLAASRPEIVAAFMRYIAGYWKADSTVSLVAYPLMKIRCTYANEDYFENDGSRFANAAFAAAQHIRPRFFETEYWKADDVLTEAAKAFDRIEQVVGPDSPILIAPLAEIADLTAAQVEEKNDIPAGQIEALVSRGKALTKKLGAKPYEEILSEIPTTVLQWTGNMKAYVKIAPLEYAYTSVLEALNIQGLPAADKLSAIEIVAMRIGPDQSDRRVRTLLRKRFSLLRQLDQNKIIEMLARTAKLDPMLCSVKAALPVMTDSGITTQDYPIDAVFSELSGGTVIDIDIGTNQKVTRLRQIVEAPPLVFSDALAKAIAAMKVAPAKNAAGREGDCKAFRTQVRWELPAD